MFGVRYPNSNRKARGRPPLILLVWQSPPERSPRVADSGGGLIDAVEFQYSHSDTQDGGLDWHGWSSTTAIGRVEFSGDYVVIDGLQALVPAPGAMALLGLGGLLGTRRRRRA